MLALSVSGNHHGPLFIEQHRLPPRVTNMRYQLSVHERMIMSTLYASAIHYLSQLSPSCVSPV